MKVEVIAELTEGEAGTMLEAWATAEQVAASSAPFAPPFPEALEPEVIPWFTINPDEYKPDPRAKVIDTNIRPWHLARRP